MGSVADIQDSELLRRALNSAIRNGGKRRPAWVKVMDAFQLGSTYASQLCRRFGVDPDSGKELPVTDNFQINRPPAEVNT